MQDGLGLVKSGGRAVLNSDLDRMPRGPGPGEGSTPGKETWGSVRDAGRTRQLGWGLIDSDEREGDTKHQR